MITYPKFKLIWLLLAIGFLKLVWSAAVAQSLLPSDVVTNFNLTNGLVLSGSVRTDRGDPVPLGTLIAQSITGRFTTNLQGGESAYCMALPAGTYDLNLSAAFLDTDEPDAPTLVYTVSDVVTGLDVASDVTQALIVPNLPALVTVSGFVTPQGAVPTAGALQFVATDGSAFTIALFEDFYMARLPLNTYAMRAALIFAETPIGATSPRTTASVNANLEAVAVTEEQTIDIMLPATVDLSGIVLDRIDAPIAPARVVATAVDADATVPGEIDFSCRPPATFSLNTMPVTGTAIVHLDAGEGNLTGAYRMPLPIGTYRLGVTLGFDLQPGVAPVLVDLDTSPRAILYIAAPGPEIALTSDVAQNLIVPALPSVVTVSGQVTDALGQPVADAVVKVMTVALEGIPKAATFFATAPTQDDGTYTLPVLRGTSYAMMACPPSPNALVIPAAMSTRTGMPRPR